MVETEVKKISRPRIDDNAFVSAWMKVHSEGGTKSDVASRLGSTLAGVHGKFKKLSSEGVKLPALARAAYTRKKKVDVEGLNKLIQSLGG